MGYRETFVAEGKCIDRIMGFRPGRIAFENQRIRVQVLCGLVYEIDLDYLIAYSREFGYGNWWRPRQTGASLSKGLTDADFGECTVAHLKCESPSPFVEGRIYGVIRVCLSNGLWTRITWESLLCDCEPSYRYYGGFSAKSMAVSAELSDLRRRTTRVSLPMECVNDSNFGLARRVDILDAGCRVRVEVPSSYAYIAEVAEIREWSGVDRNPRCAMTRRTEGVASLGCRVVRTRRLRRGRAIRLYLAGGECWDVPTMCVLRCCEDRLVE